MAILIHYTIQLINFHIVMRKLINYEIVSDKIRSVFTQII